LIELTYHSPFVVSVGRRTADLSASNHERPFDRLPSTGSLRRAQGERKKAYFWNKFKIRMIKIQSVWTICILNIWYCLAFRN